jgi:hypothetical protein
MSATSEDRPAAHPATKDAEMGLFDKAKRELGMVDKKLLANGILARGNVVSAVPDGMTIGQDRPRQRGAARAGHPRERRRLVSPDWAAIAASLGSYAALTLSAPSRCSRRA